MRLKWIKVLMTFSLVIISRNAQAQLDNYWTWFGHDLDFNYQTPRPGFSTNGSVGNSSICDSSGKLLFYCNGQRAYDRENRVMPYFANNYQMEGENVIIIPKNKYEYYIFGSTALQRINSSLFYALIDMRLNNAYGDLEKGQSGTLYYGNFYTVGAANKKGGGYWLLTKTLDSIYAFPVDDNGIGKPVITYIYEKLTSDKNVDPVRDELLNTYTIITSHDSKMVVTTRQVVHGDPFDSNFSTIYAYDFNNSNGEFTNQRLLAFELSPPSLRSEILGNFYCSAFSPNDSFIYVTHGPPPSPSTHLPYQWDVFYKFQRYATNIAASLYKIHFSYPIPGDTLTLIQDIKGSPDGKIYFAYETLFNSVSPKLGVINYPDSAGNACGINLFGPNFNCSQCYLGGLPLTISSYSPLSYIYSGQCGSLNFNAKADSLFTKFTWYMQDINGNTIDSVYGSKITYNFKKSGRYVVTLQGMSKAGYKKWYTDTISFTTKPLARFSVLQGNLCQYNHIQFTNQNQADTSGESWHWDFGDPASGKNSSILPAPNHIYSSTGHYTVKLSCAIGACTADTSEVINILPAPKPGFSVSDSLGCQPLTVKLTSDATGAITKTYYDFGNGTNASTASPTVDYNSSGSFKILQEVTGPNGCTTKDSATITVNPTPGVKFQRTVSVCLGTEIEFGVPAIAGYIYSWTSVPPGFISDLSKPIDVPKASTTYNLKETISATGCSDSGKVLYCFVEQRPVASFAYEHTRGFDYSFAIKRSKNVSYSFDFGDSQQVSINKNDTVVSHSFPGNGKYVVTFSSISDTGLKCESFIIDTIIVNEPFSLNIFPNPFSLQTDINYMLLKPGHVRISLTDGIGRQIGTLVDKELGPGEYDTYFNAPLWETRPGMYFVIFQLDDTLIVKKIIQMESNFY